MIVAHNDTSDDNGVTWVLLNGMQEPSEIGKVEVNRAKSGRFIRHKSSGFVLSFPLDVIGKEEVASRP
ncbi:hypothetical protein PoB_000966400 [Plakobranchus ocellatus]|uniref:Uncharacterized protein n=1 Tax=Plakobranchus ocellatus TaxID=259542 RepID=A0AAV3YJG3_9GAST|nr:hypothetical protein PoB_000966400 [Plakobranchus ocellatus]